MSIKPNPFGIFDYAPMPVWINHLKETMRQYEPANGCSDDDTIRNSDIINMVEQDCGEMASEMDVLIILVEMGFMFKVKPHNVILWKVKKARPTQDQALYNLGLLH